MHGPDLEKQAEQEEQVMSEVHLGCPPGSSGSHISHFTISIPPDVDYDSRCDEIFKGKKDREGEKVEEGEVPMQQVITVDEDGDLILTRRPSVSNHTLNITIQHNITTSIPSVGLQVWKAELVLCDFVLHKMFTSSEFDGGIALELGAGTGLVGMLLASVAKTVFLTDHGDEILQNCAYNVYLNSKVLNYQGAIHVRELDWMGPWPPAISLGNTKLNMYSWSHSEVEEAQEASLLLAADVIYSDDLTDALFHTVMTLMALGSDKVLYLALEKRYNFSLYDVDVVANGYSQFRSYVREEGENEDLKYGSSPCFVGKCIDLSLIPQYMKDYERGNDLELWQIKYNTRKPEP